MTPGVRETDASFRNEAVRDRLLRPGWTILTFGLVAVLQEVGLARLLSFKLQTFEIQAAVCVGHRSGSQRARLIARAFRSHTS